MDIVNMILPILLIILTIVAGIVSVTSKKRQKGIQKQEYLLKKEENYMILEKEKKHIIYLEDSTKDKKEEIILKEGENFFGRDSQKVDYVLENRYISRIQFVIKVCGRQMLIWDYNSTNGTYLNEKRLTFEPRILKKGDIIRVGEIYLKVYR